MIDKDTKIKKAMPPKRESMCFELQHAILLPAGTMLRQEPGKPGFFTAPVAHGVFSVTTEDGISHPATFKRVISA